MEFWDFKLIFKKYISKLLSDHFRLYFWPREA